MKPGDETIDWLLAGDPAIRWQVMRDLLDKPRRAWEAERDRVATQGWGKAILELQDPDGRWDKGVYTPKWTSVTYTLLTLRHLGLPAGHPQALRGCDHFYFRGLEEDGGINLFQSRTSSETCVNGMLLTLLSHFRHPDERLHSVAQYLIGEQMDDGGWNCRWNGRQRVGASHASFNTTLLVLQGLAEYCSAYTQPNGHMKTGIGRGHEFLLRHRVFKSHRTGRVFDPRMTFAHFPPRWHYDFLAALDYFQGVRAARDDRVQDAIDLLLERRTRDGRWTVASPWTGRTFFEMEKAGKPSRWNTLRALRVLRWWEQQPT
jgi:hypothetical protein